MSDKLIEVNNISKFFGATKVLEDISFSVQRGDVLAILGPNGAGKSTTMRILSCFLEPSSGDAKVKDFSILHDSLKVRRQIGYLPENAPLYPEMSVHNFLNFVLSIWQHQPLSNGSKAINYKTRLDAVIELANLKEVVNQTIETLSKGFKRRVAFAQAILHDPEILLLDEPTDGLDPNQKFELRSLIREIAPQKSIIISTHILEEVSELCTRCLIIDRGKLITDTFPEKLKEISPTHTLEESFRMLTK